MKTFKKLLLAGLISAGVSLPAAAADKAMVNPQGNVLVGYWHNWADGAGYKGGNAPWVDLDEVHAAWNVVNVSFMKAYPPQKIPTFVLDPRVTDAEFIAQISQINSQGRAVLLALGGADAHIELQTGDEQAFADEIIRLTEKYGFDGLDIDLEQAAITAGDNQSVIPAALIIVKDHYRAQGKNFMITAAPEFPYLTVGGAYLPYLDALEGYYDFINPQFYNQGGDGLWVADYNNGQGIWMTGEHDEFPYYMSRALANGIDGYSQIPHDRLVYGTPANIDAAASGFENPQDIYQGLTRMAQDGQALHGIMSWSINWDMGTNVSGAEYNQQFIKDYAEFVHNGPVDPNEGFPEIAGIEDTSIQLGSEFDEMAGVTASDEEDGDLTESIIVTGVVDENSAGSYEITYSVTDSDKNTTTEVRNVDVLVNQPPVIIGVEDETIFVNEVFDPMAGVSASDSEDGDLTDAVIVSGSVDNAVVGDYSLTYSVTDSGDVTTVEERIITVKEQEDPGENTWDAATVYNTDDKVIYDAVEYTALWWTQGDVPGKSDVWKADTNGAVLEWSADTTYNGGDKALYQGLTWTASWWTKGDVPGSSDVWKQD
ncbi:immunoglobulin-like domain-containing protein [Psychromonas aquimarina]|uniref:immunoglobulin-like domain-containing protein n=1 Tax=Psychromonas aquimarina TaxID=444919 RepID=UPI0004139B47|nr:immunoglobulin-like domain-containing protein [Psychromonas aquimarina]